MTREIAEVMPCYGFIVYYYYSSFFASASHLAASWLLPPVVGGKKIRMFRFPNSNVSSVCTVCAKRFKSGWARIMVLWYGISVHIPSYHRLGRYDTYHTIPERPAPTRHFVLLRRVWFLIIKFICFKPYPLLAPKCRVGADGARWCAAPYVW
jgi:hypothetical protein